MQGVAKKIESVWIGIQLRYTNEKNEFEYKELNIIFFNIRNGILMQKKFFMSYFA